MLELSETEKRLLEQACVNFLIDVLDVSKDVFLADTRLRLLVVVTSGLPARGVVRRRLAGGRLSSRSSRSSLLRLRLRLRLGRRRRLGRAGSGSFRWGNRDSRDNRNRSTRLGCNVSPGLWKSLCRSGSLLLSSRGLLRCRCSGGWLRAWRVLGLSRLGFGGRGGGRSGGSLLRFSITVGLRSSRRLSSFTVRLGFLQLLIDLGCGRLVVYLGFGSNRSGLRNSFRSSGLCRGRRSFLLLDRKSVV